MSTMPINSSSEPRQQQSPVAQWGDLFLMELTNWRWNWRMTLITGALAPLFMIVLLGIFANNQERTNLAYILTGNLVIGLLFGTMTRIINRVEFLRFGGGLDFFATLPVQRFLFVFAMIAAFLVFALPALIITLTVGALWLALPLALHPLLLLVIPLCTIPLAGVGVFLGLISRSWGEASSWGYIMSLLFTLVGPVTIPPERLPAILIWLGYLNPATYAAAAFRQVVIGPITAYLLVDLVMLAGMSALLLWLVERKMSWREN